MKTNTVETDFTKNGLYTNTNQANADENTVINSENTDKIANINDPNYLSPFEKPQLKIQMDNFATIYAADKDIATSEGIDFTAYEAAYQAYVAYMTPLVADISAYSPINRDTYNSMVTAVQDQQKALDSATKAQYDTAINQAKTDIANGQTKYQALQADAANMKSDAANVATTASQAIASAGFANDTANAAQSSAMAAVNQAGFASDASVQASQAASSAVASALSAQSDASAAVTQATSAVADSKDAKQIAGAVSQSYKTLTDGSTMTIAELEGGLAAKLTKTDLNGYATQDWAQNQINITADGINSNLSSVKTTVDGQTTNINDLKSDSSSFKSQFTTVNDTLGKQTTDIGTLQTDSNGFKAQFTTVNDTLGKHTTDIGSLQATSKGIQASVNSKASSDQLTLLSDQLTNKISDLSSSTSSKFTQTSNDINGLVKKGDVVNQLNIDAGGILLDTSGSTAKIILSSNNIELDSANPVVMGSANITNLLTSKTIEASSITSTTKIIGSDIEAPIIHSPSGSFKLDGKTGDIIGASIHSADNSWGISKDGVINGATINASVLNLGDNGQLTGSYSVNDDTSYFQPIRGTGSLHIEHGYIQSTANVSYYNKILNGISGDKWGHWASSTQFIPATDQANPGTGNVAESTLTPAFLKLDIFNADKSLVKSRAYIDGTGLYINDGQTQSIVSMLSDYELISNGMAYLNSGIQMNKRASFTFGNLVLNGYHTIAMLDGKAINFTSATSNGSPIEVKAKTFTKLSQLSIKHDITPLSTAESSRLLNAIDIEKFRYTHDGATYKYQYGGVIDDVNILGSKRYSMPPELLSEDGTGINLDSLTGILIKTVQEQERKIGKLSMRLTKLEMKK